MERLDLSIGQRLAVGFGSAVALLVLLVGVSLSGYRHITSEQRRVMDVLRPRATAAVDLQLALQRQAISVRTLAVMQEARYADEVRQARAAASAALRRLEQVPQDADDQALLDQVQALADRYPQAADAFVVAALAGAGPEALRAPDAALNQVREELVGRVATYVITQLRKQEEAQQRVAAAQAWAAQTLLLCGGLIALIMLATAVITVRAVRVPCRRLVAAARALAAGNYPPALALAGPHGHSDGSSGRSGGRWRDELRELAAAVGRMAAALQQRELRLAAHARLSDVLSSRIDLEALGTAAIQEMAASAGCQFGALYLRSEHGQVLRRVAAYALDGAAETLAVGEGIPGQAAASRRTIVVNDIPEDTPFRLRLGVEDVPPRGIAAVPVVFGEQTTGVILVGSIRNLPERTITALEDGARLLGVSLQNALIYRRVAELAAELSEKNEELAAQNEEIQAQGEELAAQNEELQEQREQLAAQNEELAAQNEELEAQRAALLEADRQKEEFLAVASHELKSPVTSLKGFAQLLLRRAAKQPVLAPAVPLLTKIDEQANQVASRVNRLLDVSRAKMGRLPLRPERVDLAALTRRQVEQARARAGGHTLVLRLPAEPVAGCLDEGYIGQAIGNLLDNAIRYTPGAGEIHVSLTVEDGQARLEVADQGIGLSEETRAHLFEPYFRSAEAKLITADGMGIGLYLAHEVVAGHGGRIWTEDGHPRGTKFVITLPGLAGRVSRAGEPVAALGSAAGVAQAPLVRRS